MHTLFANDLHNHIVQDVAEARLHMQIQIHILKQMTWEQNLKAFRLS